MFGERKIKKMLRKLIHQLLIIELCLIPLLCGCSTLKSTFSSDFPRVGFENEGDFDVVILGGDIFTNGLKGVTGEKIVVSFAVWNSANKDIFIQTNTLPPFAANGDGGARKFYGGCGIDVFARLRGHMKCPACCNMYHFDSTLQLPWEVSATQIEIDFYLAFLDGDGKKSYYLSKTVPVKVIRPEAVDKTIRIKLN
jgi:hypothetical protein